MSGDGEAWALPQLLADIPLPGHGRTWARWQALAAVAAEDLVAARLGEGHVDAVAILAELAPGSSPPDALLGVWAAEAPLRGVRARPDGDGWCISGSRSWCSGATTVGQVLLTAHAPDGLRLFLVPNEAPGATPQAGTWPAVGMAGSDSLAVVFDQVELPAAAAVGGPGDYLDRPGFWHGAMGVAACWYGGAVGVAGALLDSARRKPDAHRLAHLGAVDSLLVAMATELRTAAGLVDADPSDTAGEVRLVAQRVRASVERGCEEVLARTGRATGATPLCQDGRHARLVADLTVYLRQSHGDADLAALGASILDRGRVGWLAEA